MRGMQDKKKAVEGEGSLLRHCLPLVFCLMLTLAGCGGGEPVSSENSAASDSVEQGELLVVNQSFSHAEFIDNIAFILPEGWSYTSFEEIRAGDGMDPGEWGYTIYIEEKEELPVRLCGIREPGPDPEGAPTALTTGGGIDAKKYVSLDGATGAWTVTILYTPAQSSAQYRLSCTLPSDTYEEYARILDELALSIGIVSVPRESGAVESLSLQKGSACASGSSYLRLS